jgi:hypothetical protein
MRLPFSKKTLHDNPLLANALGVGCIIAVPFVGWIPGPGGIPLLLAGLGLLSIHNAWARKLKTYVLHHSSNIRELLFPPNSKIQLAWDIVFVLLASSGAYLLALSKRGIIYSILSTLVLMPVMPIFLFNRNRLDRIKNKLQRNK